RGGNVMRACALLPAATGNFGKPGAGLYYLNGAGPRRIGGDYLDAPHLRRGPAASIGHMELADALADPERTQAFFSWNMNVAASAPRQEALHRALEREDLFTVVIDLFQTDTADYADVVLPAASFLEFDDLVVPYFHLTVSAQVKAQEPAGEALPNQEIFRRLAKAMGYNEPELYESDRAMIDQLLARSGLGISFDALAEKGTIDPWDEPVIQFADLAFPTPSGKIEIASAAAEAEGHPRVPQPMADPRPAPGKLRLLSPASKWLMNDSYGNDPGVQAKMGPPRVTLHPKDAAALGLKAGDRAELANETGRLVLLVEESDSVAPGSALSHKGRWPKGAPTHTNVNCLNPGMPTDMGHSSSVHGVEVSIAAAQADG
ncbi:MAG: molybdopterin dinucleotide binding domain-containing protein, partial [Kiloniellales bacterium]